MHNISDNLSPILPHEEEKIDQKQEILADADVAKNPDYSNQVLPDINLTEEISHLPKRHEDMLNIMSKRNQKILFI